MNPIIFVGKNFMFAKSKLPIEIKNKVDAFFPKFLTNPRSSAINYEKIKTFKDKSFKSVRIDKNYRAIISYPDKGNNFYMLWVDKHDDAYAWAENKYFEWNPNIHSMQLYEPIEMNEPTAEPYTSKSIPFHHPYNLTIDDLLNLGVPESEVEKVISIIKDNDLWTITDDHDTVYKTKHIISTIDINALKNISIKGIDLNYFKNMIGTNNFLRMYTYHDNVELNKTIVLPHIFKQMIPINNNIVMSAYCDNLNATKSNELLKNINNKEITKIINKFISASPVKDKF
jgi:hypothetical protein